MAFDWISEILYYPYTVAKILKIESIRVSRTSLDINGALRTIMTFNQSFVPYGLAVDPIRGCLFVADGYDANPSITRVNLDGTNVRAIQNYPDVRRPRGLAIDYEEKQVYWTDNGDQREVIIRCDYNGKNIQILLQEHGFVRQPAKIALAGDLMY